MGPLELQLYRELAIQVVRLCAQESHQDHEDSPMDLRTYRQWFDATFEKWAITPRAELDGQSPDQAIASERQQLAGQSTPESDAPHYVELYTNLPEPEPSATGAFDLSSLSNLLAPAPEPTVDAVRTGPDTEPASRRLADDETRWRAFCDRFLASWLDA